MAGTQEFGIGLVYKWFGEYESVYCQAHGHNRPIEEGETVSVALFKSRKWRTRSALM